MTYRIELKVRDVTGHFRGDDPARPVLVGVDGTRLILAVDMTRATELTEIIARGDTTDSDTWLEALVDIVAALELDKHPAGGEPHAH